MHLPAWEWGFLRPRPALFVAWLSLSFWGCEVYPFGGKGGFPWWRGWIYWVIVVLLRTLVEFSVRREVRLRFDPPVWVLLIIEPTLIALIFCPVFWGLDWLWGGQVGWLGTATVLRVLCVSVFISTCEIMIRCAAIRGMAMSELPDPPDASKAVDEAFFAALSRPVDDPASAFPLPSASQEPRLFSRLSPEVRAPMVRMRTCDHYVEVVTEKGTQRLLMRFSDALAELDGVEGMQVHRSHWVAKRAVVGRVSRQGKLGLLLSDDSLVPVARSCHDAVRAMLKTKEEEIVQAAE